MKNKNFWSILLFVGMFLVAGVGFMSCEKNNGPSGGSSSDGGSGGGSTVVNDTLEHCWEATAKYNYGGEIETYTHHIWATQKEMQRIDSMHKTEEDVVEYTYKLSTAKSKSECDALDIDPNEAQCWQITYTYKGEGSPFEMEYVWTTLTEIQKWEKEAAQSGVTMTYTQRFTKDEYSCNELNGNDPEPSVPAVYIKHPWGTGQDASWSWEQMNYDNSGEYYYYYGAWGGVGANINDAPTDADAVWYPEDEIYGANNCSMGDYVEFRYVNGSLSVYLY
jgi:hypothetical protein